MSELTTEEIDRQQAKEMAEARRLKKKKQKMMAGGGVVVLIIIVWLGLQPLRAGDNFGICRTFLETRLTYPTSFSITQYDEYGPSLRIFYTYIDAFGGTRSEMIECVSSLDTTAGYVLQDIKMNRVSIDKEELARFNLSIPGILAGKPNLVIPRPPGDDLVSLRRE